MQKSMHNIGRVGKDCTSCGMCSTVCPANCISFKFSNVTGCYSIDVDNEKCNDCGVCRRVCPVLNTEQAIAKPMGNVQNAYSGYSSDPEIRRNAASGGFISAFLLFLLEKGYVDGALISHRNGVIGESFIATTKQEIIDSKTSIYAPVDYAHGLKELKETTCQKVAVVGLPCQIQAITNWSKINKNVDSKIFIKIAIVCGKTPSTYAYRFIAKKANFNYESISSVCNRGDGWPGYMTIQHEAGQFRTSYRSKLSMGSVLSSPYLCNRGCLSCIDGLGVSADMSVSDAWLPKYTQKNDDGWNLILTLTDRAKLLLKSERIENYLHLENETTDDFYRANRRVIDKAHVGNRMREKENRCKLLNAPLTIKKKIYVLALSVTLKLFRPARINNLILTIGKAINKLKE